MTLAYSGVSPRALHTGKLQNRYSPVRFRPAPLYKAPAADRATGAFHQPLYPYDAAAIIRVTSVFNRAAVGAGSCARSEPLKATYWLSI